MKSYIKKKSVEFILFVSLCLIMLIDCVLFNQRGFETGRIFAALIAILSLFLSTEQNLFLIAFCLPFSSILKISAGSITITPVLYLIVILKMSIHEKIKYDVDGLLAIGVFATLQVLSCVLYNASIAPIISFLLSVVFVWSCAKFCKAKEWDRGYLFKNLALFFIGAVCAETIFSRFFTEIAYIVAPEKHALIVRAGRFAAFNIDPNEYAQLVLMGIGLIVSLIATTKSRLKIALYLMTLCFLAYNGFLTYSKSYALTLIALFVVLFFMLLRDSLKNSKKDAVIIFGVSCVIFLVGSIFLYKKVLIPVFENRSTDDILTGRGEIWAQYVSSLLKRIDCLILGCGASNTAFLLPESDEVAHNLYIEYIAQFGILGLMCLYFVWKETIKCVVSKARTYLLIFLLAFAITSLGISANSNDAIFFLLVCVCIPYVNTLKKDEAFVKIRN